MERRKNTGASIGASPGAWLEIAAVPAPRRSVWTALAPGVWPPLSLAVGLVPIALGAPILFGLALGAGVSAVAWRASRARDAQARALLDTLSERLRRLDPARVSPPVDATDEAALEEWNAAWSALQQSIARAQGLAEHVRALPRRLDDGLGGVARAADLQEAAVEETASLLAHMRQTMIAVDERVDRLVGESERSAASIEQLGRSIEEVAASASALHGLVDASTSSVHQMSASIRQVASGAERVQAMAESTATAMTEMDRSVQEVSNNASEAAALTQRAHQGASAGREAVDATIGDIERISTLTGQAMERLHGLVGRVSEIANILSAIDEINDETNLLSLNAAIIAAQAGEQGKAFLVVANHVKTLARRTSSSTQDIEKLIFSIEQESSQAVEAMEAGLRAVAQGVDRSRDAGEALETIQIACSDASERVGEIARSVAEQSRNSKGVAEATQRTSEQIQQISEAIAEQRRASEAMLESSERALESCLRVHHSTDEQRETGRHITEAIGAITERIHEIGVQTRRHRDASTAVGEAVGRLLENAKASASGIEPLRRLVADLDAEAEALRWPGPDERDDPARGGPASGGSARTARAPKRAGC